MYPQNMLASHPVTQIHESNLIAKKMDDLEKHLSELMISLGHLREKIDSVLTPTPPLPAPSANVSQEIRNPVSVIHYRLEGMTSLVCDIKSNLADIISRVEL